MINIRPTQTCFDDAAEYAINNRHDRIYVCHGLVNPRIRRTSKPFMAHAWIQDLDRHCCLEWAKRDDGEIVRIAVHPTDYFYSMRPLKITYYTPAMFIYYNWLYNITGPFEAEYQLGCRDVDEPIGKDRNFSVTTLRRALMDVFQLRLDLSHGQRN